MGGWILGLGAAALALCGAAAAGAPAGMPPAVAQALAAQGLSAGGASFVVVDADSGRTLVAHNADVQRSPASTIKVVTTYASLELLGPAFTWHTRALLHGTLKDGVLDGDLVLQGGGDPYMTIERWWSFARELRGQGLRAIHGDIVIDDAAFAPIMQDPGEFDGRPERAYNVIPNAMMVNFQTVEFHLMPNRAARRIEVAASPAPANLVVDNQIRYVDGRCRRSASKAGFDAALSSLDRVVFTGALSPQCAARDFTRVVQKPQDYAYGTFVSLWRELGGEFNGGLRVEAAPRDARLLLSYDSLSLGEIVRLTNKYSNNLMARHLLLTIGQERYGAPATVDKGVAAIQEWAKEKGINLQDAEIDNGAGLSRTAHLSAASLAGVLQAAYHSPFAPEFLASLPLAGIDGTLRSKLKDTAPGDVRLKTGHLDGVSGIAGYVTNARGKSFVVVSLINDPRVDGGAGEPVHGALVRWVLDNP